MSRHCLRRPPPIPQGVPQQLVHFPWATAVFWFSFVGVLLGGILPGRSAVEGGYEEVVEGLGVCGHRKVTPGGDV